MLDEKQGAEKIKNHTDAQKNRWKNLHSLIKIKACLEIAVDFSEVKKSTPAYRAEDWR